MDDGERVINASIMDFHQEAAYYRGSNPTRWSGWDTEGVGNAGIAFDRPFHER